MIILSVCTNVLCQQSLTSTLNAYRDGDGLYKVQIGYNNIGGRGESQYWDCPPFSTESQYYIQSYRQQGDTMICLEHETMYQYKNIGDSILCMGFENRSTEIHYDIPILQMSFPFAYEDSIGGVFAGHGQYGQRRHIGIWGRNYTVADAYGKLTDGEDTISNILRVHQHSEFRRIVSNKSMPQVCFTDIDTVIQILDTLAAPLLIEDRYRWYHAGNRYPIWEVCESKTVSGTDTLSHFQTAFLCLPEAQMEDLSEDPENEYIQTQQLTQGVGDPQEEEISGRENSFPIRIEYTHSSGSKSLELHYTLSESGPVSFSLYDILGTCLASSVHSSLEAGEYTEQLVYKTQPFGQTLVLYIRFSDEEKLLKFQK